MDARAEGSHGTRAQTVHTGGSRLGVAARGTCERGAAGVSEKIEHRETI